MSEPESLNIALYYPWIYLRSGGERTILELIRRSRHKWTLFTSHYEPENTFPELTNRQIIEVGRVSVKRSIGSVAAAAIGIIKTKLPLENFDALFVLSEGLGDMILFQNSQIPSLCYCLTPLRAAFDPIYNERSYATRKTLSRLSLLVGLGMFKIFDRLAWKRYTKMLFISREVVNRAKSAGLLRNREPEILYTGPGLVGHNPPTPSHPYFLLPGRIMWTKNIELGINSFKALLALRPEYQSFRLVVAGFVDAKSKPYFESLRELAASCPQIEFCVEPSDSQLSELYSNCYGVLFTAFNEDLGLVPIEGMAFGKPVIAVNCGGPRETIEDGVQGYLVEPDPTSWAHRMAMLIDNPDLAAQIGAAGIKHSQLFGWDHFAKRVDDILEELAERRGPKPVEIEQMDYQLHS